MNKTILNRREMIRGSVEVHRAAKGRIAWATAFDARRFESLDFAGQAIRSEERRVGKEC